MSKIAYVHPDVVLGDDIQQKIEDAKKKLPAEFQDIEIVQLTHRDISTIAVMCGCNPNSLKFWDKNNVYICDKPKNLFGRSV